VKGIECTRDNNREKGVSLRGLVILGGGQSEILFALQGIVKGLYSLSALFLWINYT